MRSAKGARVGVINAEQTHRLGEGTYLGDFPRPWWNHPADIKRCEAAIRRQDARETPVFDHAAFARRQVEEGKITQADADLRLARILRWEQIDAARPVADRAWSLAAFSGNNPKIQLDSGKIVWGCETWWFELDHVSPRKKAFYDSLPLQETTADTPDTPWAFMSHPDLAHYETQHQGLVPGRNWTPASAAVLSPDRRYRYVLSRSWGTGTHAVFLMLNPSTADGFVDDRTIKKCIHFAKQWGCGGLFVVNAFAFRATKPAYLAAQAKAGVDITGPDNIKFLLSVLCAQDTWPLVAAWGAEKTLRDHDQAEILRRLMLDTQRDFYCLGLTKDGIPRHPLFLLNDTDLQTYQIPRM